MGRPTEGRAWRWSMTKSWPLAQRGYADAGYQGPRAREASPIRIEIVRKLEGQIGFAVHAKRRGIERFFARICRNRQLVCCTFDSQWTQQLPATSATAGRLMESNGQRHGDSATSRSPLPLPICRKVQLSRRSQTTTMEVVLQFDPLPAI